MSKNTIGTLKIIINGNSANMGKIAQPFGMKGISSQAKSFCDSFNAQTKGRENEELQAFITIYEDKTISYVIKTEPVSRSLLKALNVEKGSGTPNRIKRGVLPMSKIREIAEHKMEDLNAYDIEAAIKIVEGTARSLGIDIEPEKVTL